MNSLERIKEFESYLPFERNSNVPKRWYLISPGALPMEIGEDFEFLLKAFKAMREIAITQSYDPWSHGEKHYSRIDGEDEIDKEFEKRMSDV